MMNGNGGYDLLDEILSAIQHEYRWDAPQHRQELRSPPTGSEQDLSGFAGRYLGTGSRELDARTLVITHSAGVLRADLPSRVWVARRLYAESPGKFVMVEGAYDEVEFERGPNGSVVAAVINRRSRYVRQ